MIIRLIVIAFLALPLLAASEAPLVATSTVAVGNFETSQSFTGTLYFDHVSKLAAQTSGLALDVSFDTTDYVKKGSLLVTLERRTLEAQLRALDAKKAQTALQLERSEKELARYENLLAQESVSQQQYDNFYFTRLELQQQLLALSAEREALQITMEKTRIYAPFSGIITERSVEKGEWVAQGGIIATLADQEHLHALFEIPASLAQSVTKDQKLDVTVMKKSYEGVVQGVVVQGDALSRTFALKVAITPGNHPLFAGMEARLNLQKQTSPPRLIVPRDAVIQRFGQEVVFTVTDGKAKMIPVKVIGFKMTAAAVEADALSEGMQVIVKGNERLLPDQSVRVE